MSTERDARLNADLVKNMIDFMRIPPTSGVNNYTIKGPVNVPTYIDMLVGIFPTPGLGHLVVGGSGRRDISNDEVLGRVLDAKISERVARLPVSPDNPVIREKLKNMMELLAFPYIMLAIGEARDSHEDVESLYAIQGIKPAAALKELQERVKLYNLKDHLRRDSNPT